MNGPGRFITCFAPAAILLLLVVSAASAAPGATLWERSWNLDPPQFVNTSRVAPAPTGDVYLCVCLENGATRDDWAVVRYTSAGVKKWQRTYSGPVKTERLEAAAADAEGNVILVGSSDQHTDDTALLVVKWSRAGARKWVRRIDGAVAGADDNATDVAVDGAGNVYVCGYVARATSGTDWLVVKYSPGGKTLWKRWYAGLGGDGFEIAQALARDAAGRIYVAGSRDDGAGTNDLCIARYSPAGHRDWLVSWGHTGDISDYAADIAVGKAGVAVAANCSGPSTQVTGVVLKRRLNGAKVWASVFGGPDGTLSSILLNAGIDTAGRVTVSGSVKMSDANGYDYALRRYSSAGQVLSSLRVGGTAHLEDTATAMRVTAAGTIYATGNVVSATTGRDVRSVAVAKTWAPIFTKVYDDPAHGNDDASSLALTSGAVYVAGRSAGDAWLIKYAR